MNAFEIPRESAVMWRVTAIAHEYPEHEQLSVIRDLGDYGASCCWTFEGIGRVRVTCIRGHAQAYIEIPALGIEYEQLCDDDSVAMGIVETMLGTLSDLRDLKHGSTM